MPKHKIVDIHLPLVITGYILFALLIVAVVLSTVIPWGGMLLFDPHVLRYNVLVFTIALTVGSFLPAVVGYAIGHSSIQSKSKLSRRFNGVLLGLLAYWIMSILSVYITIPYKESALSLNTHVIIANLLPSAGVAIIATIAAVAHSRSKHAKHDLISYHPYVALLIGLIAIITIWPLIQELFTQQLSLLSLAPLAVTLLLGAYSYLSLRHSKLRPLHKLSWAAVSVSVASVAVFVSFQLTTGVSYYLNATPTMEFQSALTSFGWLLGLVGWGIYWYAQTRALSQESHKLSQE